MMEYRIVALFRANGEGIFEMADHSSSMICLYLGAMGRTHNGVDLMSLLSLAHVSGLVAAMSAQRYVRAARSGCGRGVRMVGFAYFSSFSSRK